LADGCCYASKTFNPSYILDMATLTGIYLYLYLYFIYLYICYSNLFCTYCKGAQLIATGKNHGALYCNDDELEAAAIMIGKNTGDLVHPLPFAPEFYRQEFASQVADMKNSVADRGNAQSSCAGQFIGKITI
jgi:probable aminopeptidase NPEPL1